MGLHYKYIPTREVDGTWSYMYFETRESFRDFLVPLLKEPGKYNFDEVALKFNEYAQVFTKLGSFCQSPKMSRDYKDFWDREREKCRKGCFFKGKNDNIWFLPGYFYHWINFLQIYNKAKKAFTFPDTRDVQYHIALYEFLAELHDLNAAIVKKRQIASSYFHTARIFNKYAFEEGYVIKIGASDKKYIDGTNGCWKFLNQYHNFTNKHTPWAFENSPSRVFSWTQKVETRTADGRKIEVGTMSSITGLTFDKDPTAGVGGATDLFFYEEGGIAPTADVTYGYMKAALREGAVITGQFIIAGSVGDLKQCEPLKDFIYKPDKHGFYAVDSNLIDDNGTVGRTALFIPEQWGMPPFIDEFGNSKVQEALDYLYKEFQEKRNILNPSDFQLEISQRPRNLKEAFDIRTVSIFPIQHTSRQIRRIEENEYAVEYVELERTEQNTIKAVPSTREPIKVFPLEMGALDKKGVICIYKHPQGIPAHGRFLAAIDPVEVGGTKTSASLASIYIYEVDVQVLTEQSSFKGDLKGYTEITTPNGTKQMGLTKESKDVKVTSHIEGGKIVASWCGRYDDPNETNEQISKLVEYYNARALCENNKTSFINYMINKKRQKYLVTKEEMVFDKDLNITSKSQQTYGVTMTTRLLEVILEYAVNSITEVLEERQDEDGNVTYVKYGVERIPDKMLLVEMQSYYPGLNADRLISYGLLMALVQIRKQTGQLKQKLKLDNTGNTNNSLESINNLGKFNMKHLDLFPNAGKEIKSIGKANKFRNPFRNIN